MAKVDIHCHSVFSDQPVNWLFRKLGTRESYTPVQELYHRLKSRGMDFVTITDHNRIDGAIELAERYPDCFVGCEFTVNFYREPAALHLCVYDLNEEQYRMGLKLHEDVREFADYFREQGVLVSVPHPLHCNRGRLTQGHLEQLLLLFDYFEEKNGLQMDAANRMQKELLDKLTPGLIEALQKKHGIKSCSEAPWVKGRLGGSDDHCSFFLGRCWTEVDGARDYREFLNGVREKRSSAHGRSMTALAFSHATQSIWINAILDRYCKPGSLDDRLVTLVSHLQPHSRTRKWINRLASGSEHEAASGRRQSMMKRFLVKKLIRLRLLVLLYSQKKFLQQEAMGGGKGSKGAALPGSALILDSFKSGIKALITHWRKTGLLFNTTSNRDLQQETHDFISNIFNNLYRHAFAQWLHHLRTGDIPEAFAKLSLILPGMLPVLPYLMGYKQFYDDNQYLKEIGQAYQLNHSPRNRPEKWGWFTDTLMDVNGAAKIIKRYTRLAKGSAVAITAITSHPDPPPGDGDFISFQPLFHFPLPEYELMTLAIPPILDVIHHCEQQGYTRLIISSPGPMGLVGLWIANLLNIPVSGIYHTDLPSYTAKLTGDSLM
jgi:predicted metal-dependent phosphoesterase TrpH